MSAENKAAVRRLIKEVWNKGKLDAADELVAANYTAHDPTTPMPAPGREGMKMLATMYRTAFPDLQLTIDDIAAEGNKVTIRWTARGTHKAELMGIAATGKKVSVTGISIIRIANGKIAEEWLNWDALGMMQQLGAVAQVGQARAATR